MAFLTLSVLLLNSCQIKEEVNVSSNPSTEEILKSIKSIPQYNEYIDNSQKIQEMMPEIIKNTTKEQKLVYNSIISRYNNRLDIFKTKDSELVTSISDITKSLEGLRKDRINIIKSIHTSLLIKYPSLTFNEVVSVLHNDTKSNARLSSCSSEAYTAAWNTFEYVLQAYGDVSVAYMVADWVYSKTYMSCLDPIGNGSGMAMA